MVDSKITDPATGVKAAEANAAELEHKKKQNSNANEESDDESNDGAADAGDAKKKKKKKKKSGGGGANTSGAAGITAGTIAPMKQTFGNPTVPVALLYSKGIYGIPEQEVQPHPYDPSTVAALSALHSAAPSVYPSPPDAIRTAVTAVTASTSVLAATVAVNTTNANGASVNVPHHAAIFPSIEQTGTVPFGLHSAAAVAAAGLSTPDTTTPTPPFSAAAVAATAAAVPAWRGDASRTARDAFGALMGLNGVGGVPRGAAGDDAGGKVATPASATATDAKSALAAVDLEERVRKLRCAAEVHREVRGWLQATLRPGMRYIDVCDGIEERVRRLVGLPAVVLWGAGAPGLGAGGAGETDTRTAGGAANVAAAKSGKGGAGAAGASTAGKGGAGGASTGGAQGGANSASAGAYPGVSVLSARPEWATSAATSYPLSALYPTVFPGSSASGTYSGTTNVPAGNAFPTGCSVNHVAAHDTPNLFDASQNRVVTWGDLTKWDFGVQIDGEIIDCAFTHSFDPRFDGLKEAVLDATNTGIAAAGIDARLCDIGAAIQEAMESYEVCLGEKAVGTGGYTYGAGGQVAGSAGEIKSDDRARSYVQVRSVSNLCGHTIGKGVIHGGKSVPMVRGGPKTRLEEGDLVAVETFGTTGTGSVREDGICSHYGLSDVAYERYKGGAAAIGSGLAAGQSLTAPQLYKYIQREFGSLAFARKWVQQRDIAAVVAATAPANASQQQLALLASRVTQTQVPSHTMALKTLVANGTVTAYPPLVDRAGSYVAQYEHTFILRPTCKEVLSRGLDF